MIEESKDLFDVPNEKADWFINEMTLVDALNISETWEDYANQFSEFCKLKSIKSNNCSEFLIHTEKVQKSRLLNSNMKDWLGWLKYLHSDWSMPIRNVDNKTEFIRAVMGHFKSTDVRKKLIHQIIVIEEEKTWYIIKDGIVETPGSNHVEADTRIKKKKKLYGPFL